MLDLNTITSVATLNALKRDPGFSTQVPQIEARIAVLKAKPGYTFKPKFNAKGGLVMPMVVYRNSAEEVIKAMQSLLADERWQNYSK
jgi:hypothetical protein